MIHLAVNMLLISESHVALILRVDYARGIAFTIRLNDAHAWPEPVEIDAIMEGIDAGAITLGLPEVVPVAVNEDGLSDAEVKVRDRRWNLIEDLVANEPAIFYPHIRGRLVKEAIARHNVGHYVIDLSLRLFWQGGKRKNALLPNFSNSGGKGKHRQANGKPQGRMPVNTDVRRPPVDDEMRAIFKNAIELDWLKNPKKGLDEVYDDMIGRDFSETFVINAQGNPYFKVFDKSQRPSFRQFDHFRRTEYPRKDQVIARIGTIHYAQKHRPILGSSAASVSGPGSQYQIDATIADIYLVSRFDRKKIVGRPVLYFVTDTFTSMITGLYVGFEGPSWVSAMQALSNAVSGKVAYCAEFGIPITEADWPCQGLPEVIRGDKGEMAGTAVNTFINVFGVRVENASAWRPDLKGIVEQRFRLIQERYKPYAPGYVMPDYTERGGRDYRLDAKLDIYEFTQIIILCVLEHNNKRPLTTYARDADMIADQVPTIPRHLWEWGIYNRTGRPMPCNEALARVALMPTTRDKDKDEAVVYPDGIHFKHCIYTCDRAWSEGWFDEVRITGRTFPVSVAYDLRRADNIYIWNDDRRGYAICHMTEKSRQAYAGMTFWEVEHSFKMDRKQDADYETPLLESKINTTAAITRIIDEADAKTALALDPTMSKASRTGGIKANHAEELNRERHTKAAVSKEDHPPAAPAKVVPLNAKQDFSYRTDMAWLRQQREMQQRGKPSEENDDEQ